MESTTPTLTACERCQRRKAKCDKALPACSSCVRVRAECQYSYRNPAVRRNDVERLERRLRQLETRNNLLSRQLRESQQPTTAYAWTAQDRSPSSAEQADGASNETRHVNNSVLSENEIASQVSDLSLNAGAERQFLGPASGLLLATLLRIDTRSGPQDRWEESNQSADLHFLDGCAPAGGQGTPQRVALPTEKVAQNLLSAYLAHDHLCYPFLHPTVLQKAIRSIYDDPDYYHEHSVEAFTMDMVFAISTAQISKFDRRALPDAATHYHRAMCRLGQVLETGGIVVLQAILLICQYRMLSAAHDTSTSMWHLIGIAARICLELGLHRESVYVLPRDMSITSEESYLAFLELKRRCFWCVFAMDRIVSLILGRPLAINIDDIDTELPRVGILANSEPRTSPYLVHPAIDLLDASRTAIFVHITRYRIICGKILTQLHNNTKARKITTAEFHRIRLDLGQELEAWRQDIETLPQLDINFEGMIKSSFGSRDWYNLLFYNGILTLYRPSVELQGLPHDSEILRSIFHAAKQSITTYGYLYRTRKINYTWMTLHAVFIAGLSYVYALRTHFRTRRHQMRPGAEAMRTQSRVYLSADPAISQVVSETRTCSTVLVAISEHWNYARNCHLVFGRLSDAILADVVQFFTQPAEGGVANALPPFLGQNELGTTQVYAEAAGTQSGMPLDNQFGDVINNYRDCFADFQGLFENSPLQGNEMAMQASQPWLFGIEALDGSL